VDAQTKVWLSDELLQDGEFHSLKVRVGEPPGRVNVGALPVEIEEVLQAEWPSETKPDLPKKCIVIRLGNVGDKKYRFRAQIISAGEMEEEHRYFTHLGKVTAIFWPKRDIQEFMVRILAIDTIKERLSTPAHFELDRDAIHHNLLGEANERR